MTVKYKGYEAVQSDYNNHVMIVKDGRMVMHIDCTENMSAKELRGKIERCIMIREDDSFGSSTSTTDEDVGGPRVGTHGGVPDANEMSGGDTCSRGGATRDPMDMLIALACCSLSKLSCEQCPFQKIDSDTCNSWTDDEVVEAVRRLRRLRGDDD